MYYGNIRCCDCGWRPHRTELRTGSTKAQTEIFNHRKGNSREFALQLSALYALFSTAEKLEIGNIPFISTAPKPGRQEALEYYQGITRTLGININLYERVLKILKSEAIFKVETSKTVYSAKNVVIATGFYDIPKLMKVPGENLDKVKHYYTEPYPYAKQKIVVVGASNSAVDAALETYRKGAEVTMIIKGDRISDSVKYWVKPDIENRIAEGSIKGLFWGRND